MTCEDEWLRERKQNASAAHVTRRRMHQKFFVTLLAQHGADADQNQIDDSHTTAV